MQFVILSHIFIQIFLFSMSQERTVIKLGRSRSPSGGRSGDSEDLRRRLGSEASSRDYHPSNDFNILNASSRPMDASLQQSGHYNMVKSSHFTPVDRKNNTIKENILSPTQINPLNKSPHQAVIYHKSPPKNVSRVLMTYNGPVQKQTEVPVQRPSNIPVLRQAEAPRQPDSSQTEKESQLIRKIRVLETRIQELHMEKQNVAMKSHEENRRLTMENQYLKKQLSQCERVKNNQIFGLQQQLGKMNQHIQVLSQSQQLKSVHPIHPVSAVPMQIVKKNQVNADNEVSQSKKQLKNMIYVDDQNQEKEDGQTSLVAESSDEAQRNEIAEIQEFKEAETHQVHVPVLKSRAPEEEKSTEKLKQQIFVLSSKNKILNSELDQMKDAVVQTTAMIEENNKSIMQEYESKIMKLKEQISILEAEKVGNQQSFMKEKHELKQKIARLEEEKHNISASMEESKNHLVTQIAILENLVQERNIQLETKMVKASEEVQKSAAYIQTDGDRTVQDSCQRCKELIKTLVKLNQKTFSKTA